MLRRNWTLSASRGFPASVAALPWLLNSPRRPYPIDLLLCGHHYRASEIALLAAGATVYGETGAVSPAGEEPVPGHPATRAS